MNLNHCTELILHGNKNLIFKLRKPQEKESLMHSLQLIS